MAAPRYAFHAIDRIGSWNAGDLVTCDGDPDLDASATQAWKLIMGERPQPRSSRMALADLVRAGALRMDEIPRPSHIR